MGNPAGHVADGLHFLRLHELGFHSFLDGNVADDAQGGGAAAPSNRYGVDLGPYERAVLSDQPDGMLRRDDLVVLPLLVQAPGQGQILGGNEVKIGPVLQVIAAVAEHGFRTLVVEPDIAGLQNTDGIVGVFENRPKPLFAGTKLSFGPFGLTHVPDRQPAAPIPKGDGGDFPVAVKCFEVVLAPPLRPLGNAACCLLIQKGRERPAVPGSSSLRSNAGSAPGFGSDSGSGRAASMRKPLEQSVKRLVGLGKLV